MKHLSDELNWDDIYRRYTLNEIPWELKRPDEPLKRLVESGALKKGKVLDVCSGAGTQSIYLTRKGFKVTGIEISPTAVEISERRSRKAGVKCSFIKGDILSFPFKAGGFDIIIDRGCFHHIPKDKRNYYLKGIYRVLRDGGKYYLKCFSYKNGKAWNHFRKQDIVRYFSPCFDILEMEHIDNGLARKKGVRYLWYAFMEKRDKTFEKPVRL